MLATPQARRNGLLVLFALSGLVMSSWVSRTPDIRDLVGASTVEMGLILLGLSAGSMVGVLAGGPLVARFGAKRITLICATLFSVGAAVIGVGAGLGSGPIVALGLGIFGLGMGAAEIGLNVEGGEVELALGRSTLPLLHGAYSLATAVGASIGMALTAVRFPVVTHMLIVAVAVIVALTFAIRPMPANVGRRSHVAHDTPRTQVWRDPRLLLIGVIVLALAMAEGTATDWLPLLMVDGHGFSATLGSGVYAIFAATMTIGRFSGGWFVDRFGQAAVLGASAVIGAVGLALVAFVDNPVIAACVSDPVGTRRRQRVPGRHLSRGLIGSGLDGAGLARSVDRLRGLPGRPSPTWLPRRALRTAQRDRPRPRPGRRGSNGDRRAGPEDHRRSGSGLTPPLSRACRFGPLVGYRRA